MFTEVCLMVIKQTADQLPGKAPQDCKEMQNVLGDPIFAGRGHPLVESKHGEGGQGEGGDPGREKRQTKQNNQEQ